MGSLTGFSKLDRAAKLEKLAEEGFLTAETADTLRSFHPENRERSLLFENMTENVVSTYPLPFSIAPGFLINGREYAIPMVTEESSVVAAASWSARYWAERGGFRTRVISEKKIGQIHFTWNGSLAVLQEVSAGLYDSLRSAASPHTAGMESRGGGITGFELVDLSNHIENYYQIRVTFLTADSMGANFINTCLEAMSAQLPEILSELTASAGKTEVILSILSNHTPDCRVVCTVECETGRLTGIRGTESPEEFARRFALAARIAEIDPYRAVTHNKGIYNGIDAVILATANDTRAVEAAGHAYAAAGGHYTALTRIEYSRDHFSYTLELPMAVGTVGGLTRSHPMAAASLALLGNPSAGELMQIAAAAGMANNFSAIKALVTTGIQAGHMPLHHRKQTL